MAKKSLQDRTKEFSNLLDFTEGREKATFDELHDRIVTICDFGFIKNDEGGEYACFIIDEESAKFYFGGKVLTENLRELETEGYRDQIKKEGLPTLFSEKMSKNKRNYVTVKFYPQ